MSNRKVKLLSPCRRRQLDSATFFITGTTGGLQHVRVDLLSRSDGATAVGMITAFFRARNTDLYRIRGVKVRVA